MKAILVPTDFSDTAYTAGRYAAELALKLDAEITLMHAWHIPYSGASTGTFVSFDHVMSDDTKSLLNDQLKALSDQYPNLKVKTASVPAMAFDGIKELCQTEFFDLIIMGTTGASGFIGKFLGSNTSNIIGNVKVPIIAVPDNSAAAVPQNILGAVDLTQKGDEQLFEPLKVLSEKLDAKVEFINIIKDKNVSLKDKKLAAADFDEAFDEKYHRFHYKEEDDIEEGILDYIADKNIDLLTIVTRQKNIWEKLMQRSVAKSIIKQAQIPTLVLPE